MILQMNFLDHSHSLSSGSVKVLLIHTIWSDDQMKLDFGLTLAGYISLLLMPTWGIWHNIDSTTSVEYDALVIVYSYWQRQVLRLNQFR